MSVINRLKLDLINFLRHFSWISRDLTRNHLKENEKSWKQFLLEKKAELGRYITYQPMLTFLLYGRERKLWKRYITKGRTLTADFNSCEVIAVTNALINLGFEEDIKAFPKILAAFEKNGAVLSGYFGTAPRMVVEYLRKRGLECVDITNQVLSEREKSVGNSQLDEMNYTDKFYMDEKTYLEKKEEYQPRTAYIMICQVTRNFLDGVHTMCIIKKDKSYQVLNDYHGNKMYDSLHEAVSSYNNRNGALLALYEIYNSDFRQSQ